MEKELIALMGPSGSGKTTLGFRLSNDNNISIPRHITTRKKRIDDIEGFYRYLTHQEYKDYYDQGEFIISSGDSQIIDEKFGNFYGVLYNDCNQAWNITNNILLFASYKDILTLNELRNKYDVKILNITFNNLVEGIKARLINNPERNHSKEDIEWRIASAQRDYDIYNNLIEKYSNGIIYTDIMNKNETYEEACKILKLQKNERR